jgi:hypothetical protein
MKTDIKNITRRVLLLGMGGSGQTIAAKVMQSVGDSLSLAVRVYDTDILARYSDLLASCFIQADSNRAEIIRTHPNEFPRIAQMFQIENNPPTTNTEGTGQFLSQGTLLFAATLPQLINHIQTAARPLLSGTLPNRIRERGAELADDRLYAICVRSCAGGTGSGPGVFIDYLLRRELVNILGMSQRLMLVDVIIMPEPFLPHVEDKNKVLANAGVFFHMMNEYGRHDSQLRTVEFDDDPKYHITVGGGPGADLTLLLSNRNLSGDTNRGASILSLEEVYDICAHFIALHLTSPMISDFYAAFGNIQQEAKEPVYGCPGILSSFGYSEAVFKGAKVKELLTMIGAHASLKRLKGGVECPVI